MSSFYPAADPPRSQLFMSHYSFDSPKQLHERCIQNHPFNHKVQIFLPATLDPASLSSLTNALARDTHYYHAHVPLSLFLTSAFMQYIRNGLIALSVQGGIDTHDVVCIDGKGKMILSLTKDSYEQLGLTGSPSKFHPNRQRYVVEIDLLAPAMIPGKPGFDRIKWCFDNTLTTVFPMVLASVDPLGVSLPLEFPETARAKQMAFRIQCRTLNDIVVPDTTVIRTIGKNELRWRKDVSALYEWVGLAAMQSDRPPQKTDDVVKSSGCLLEISGLIPSPSILRIFDALRSLLDKTSGPEWSNMTVWGFQDSPISWIGREHGHLTSGENMYSFFLWSKNIQLTDKDHPDKDVYVVLEHVAAHDTHS
ncbi:Ribonuclease P protein subunit p40 [Mortierella antarctica]|nr:Ribonuclease P protein subunit p40 [Mortierella alpina]KAF9989301.1 Ribonuclease P protein subunit p40 [Mortierella antarctica]